MRDSLTVRAGGAPENKKVDTVITLRAGDYAADYRADDSRFFGEWNALSLWLRLRNVDSPFRENDLGGLKQLILAIRSLNRVAFIGAS